MSPTSYHLLYSAIYDTHAVSRFLIRIPQHGVCVNRFYQKSLCNFSREFTRLLHLYQTMPWLIMAEAIFSKPAMLAPATRLPFMPYFSAVAAAVL